MANAGHLSEFSLLHFSFLSYLFVSLSLRFTFRNRRHILHNPISSCPYRFMQNCVCRMRWPVFLEREILIVVGNQYIALASVSGRWEGNFGPICINQPESWLNSLAGNEVSGHLLAISLMVHTDIGGTWDCMGPCKH